MWLQIRLANLLALASTLAVPAAAAVKPHALISENMVLQQGTRVPLWGKADDGEKVTVRFQGQEVATVAVNGKWRVDLEPLKPGGPFPMTIAGKNTIQLKNVLVGEVWLCSGQSNMWWPVKDSSDPERTIAASANPSLRMFGVPLVAADSPQSELAGGWAECRPQTVPTFSAVAYHFGQHLQKAIDVPVGLIQASWGDTPAEAWMSLPALKADPDYQLIFDRWTRLQAIYPELVAKHKERLKAHAEAVAKAKAEGKTPPPVPRLTEDPWKNRRRPTVCYNAMIFPLQPFTIKGVVWYQGESNVNRAYLYRTLFPALIDNWRKDWKQDFPFLFVQIAPFLPKGKEPPESTWAELREAQRLTLRLSPHTAMVVTTDVGDPVDVHPPQKEPVGARLALAARALAYGQKIAYSGPIYEGMQIKHSKVIISFTHIGKGLAVRGNSLTGFTVAGADRKFVKADAQIVGDRVVVSSPAVPRPVAVRYGWADYPIVNLWNQDGLPASPFRTDDFPLLSAPKK